MHSFHGHVYVGHTDDDATSSDEKDATHGGAPTAFANAAAALLDAGTGAGMKSPGATPPPRPYVLAVELQTLYKGWVKKKKKKKKKKKISTCSIPCSSCPD
jgi:hypothetical protein